VVRGVGPCWPNGWKTKKVLAGGWGEAGAAGAGAGAAGAAGAAAGLGAGAAGVGAAGAGAGAGVGTTAGDCLGASGAAVTLTSAILGMLRGLKSSWMVPAGTTAAGLAGGVAGVGA